MTVARSATMEQADVEKQKLLNDEGDVETVRSSCLDDDVEPGLETAAAQENYVEQFTSKRFSELSLVDLCGMAHAVADILCCRSV